MLPALGSHHDKPPLPGGYVRPRRQRAGARVRLSRDNEAEAMQAKVLTADEARRIAINVALPGLFRRDD
jgi:hypothetical protein